LKNRKVYIIVLLDLTYNHNIYKLIIVTLIMETKLLLKKLEGIHTIEAVMDILNVDKNKAIYYIYRLRKWGYVKTKVSSDKKRVYYIYRKNRLGGKSYYEVINLYSPIKLAESSFYKVYGREPTLEEALIYAIKSKKVRVLTAALSLFKHIDNWTLLGELTRKNHVERSVGALYDLSRKIMKTRRMTKKLRDSILPEKNAKFAEMIEGFKSKDFKEIEETWKIRIPLNKADFEDYIIK